MELLKPGTKLYFVDVGEGTIEGPCINEYVVERVVYKLSCNIKNPRGVYYESSAEDTLEYYSLTPEHALSRAAKRIHERSQRLIDAISSLTAAASPSNPESPEAAPPQSDPPG